MPLRERYSGRRALRLCETLVEKLREGGSKVLGELVIAFMRNELDIESLRLHEFHKLF